jgi:hypothetical protein
MLFSFLVFGGYLYLIFKGKEVLRVSLILMLSVFSLSTTLLVSYKYGQIGSYLKYGYNRECKEIVNMVDKDDVILINDIGWDRLPFVLRSEDVQDPEFRWELLEFIPKKHLLIKNRDLKTYNLKLINTDNPLEVVDSLHINKVVIIEDLIDNVLDEKVLHSMEDLELELLEQRELINKKVYIYKVK